MPRGSRNPVTVRRETEAAHRALRKLRAKSSIMAPISFERPVPQMQELAQETSGPIIAVRCPALPIRHSVSDLSPASGKAALTIATIDGECGPSVPVPIFCSAADGCMRASGFPTPFQNTGIVAVAVLAWRGCGVAACASTVGASSQHRRAMRRCGIDVDRLAPRVLNAVKTMGHVLPVSQSPPHVGCKRF